MNYKDVALLNDSLDRLGEGLLRKRMLDMQEADRAEQRGLQRQQLGVEQTRFDAQQQHWKNMEGKAEKEQQFRVSQADIQEDQDMMKIMLGLNATGQLSDAGRAQINKYLAGHPRFGPPGIQIVAPPKASPQAGQNSVAQALERADHYDDLADEAQRAYEVAQSDEEKAAAMIKIEKYRDGSQLLRKLARKQAEPEQPKAPERPITKKTLDAGSEITQKFTESEFREDQIKGALPIPSKKEELKTGQLYRTARGLARWDGKQFIPFQ